MMQNSGNMQNMMNAMNTPEGQNMMNACVKFMQSYNASNGNQTLNNQPQNNQQ
ncbi:hypothetical protein [Effusibacillus dendaii]|uniref:hypothetical protein n=1 Tax=Effusibacillus dendaii TaxID=2743772 RepID=UPI0019096BBA|nr:hypothetical protein [Effusibacillus dendaii]